MKLTFAGVGGAFASADYYQSNMLVEQNGKRLMIDCGTDARFSFGELGATNQNLGRWVDAVYISHCHADHIGGMEWLGFCTYFGQKEKKPTLFIVKSLVKELWRSLKGGMCSHEGVVLRLDSFFDVRPVNINDSFVWEGITFTPIQTIHIRNGMRIVPSYGLLIDTGTQKLFVTTDTQFYPRQFEYDWADVIFHDCETAPYRSGVHAHYEDLKTLPEATRAKMWLYHYQPNPALNAEADGFRGFVKKGQSFEF